MYKEHSTFKIEKTKEQPLWRYMDFWKFLQLVNSSTLFFPVAELLGDQHEGRIPEKVYKIFLEDDEKKGRTNRLTQNYQFTLEKRLRPNTLISSWTASEHENFAMWKMYAKEKLGIAIKTDFEGLKNAFQQYENDIFIGEVFYYNNQNPKYELGNMFYSFLVKHEYYRFENEVRCISSLKKEEEHLNFKNIPVDLNSLIKEVYISKFAENIGLRNILEKIKKEKALKFNISISGVNDNWI